MKTIRKIVQIICTWLMALSLTAVPVMAEGEGTTAANDLGESYSITVNSNDSSNHTFSAYQIFKGTASGGYLVDIDWGEGIDTSSTGKSGITNIDGLSSSSTYTLTGALKASNVLMTNGSHDFTEDNTATASQIAEVIKNYGDNSEKIEEFAKILSYFVTTASATANSYENNTTYNYRLTLTKTNSETGVVTGAGYYLVKDAETNEDEETSNTYSANILKLVLKDEKVNSKTESPSMSKKVYDADYKGNEYGTGYNDVADYNVGDSVKFRLYGTLVSDLNEYTKTKTSTSSNSDSSTEIYYQYEFTDMFGTNDQGKPVFDGVDKENVKIYLAKDKGSEGTDIYRMWEIIEKWKEEHKNDKNYESIIQSFPTINEASEQSFFAVSALNKNKQKITETSEDKTPYGFSLRITKGTSGTASTTSGAPETMDKLITGILSELVQKQYKYVIVEYEAKLNSNAVVGLNGNSNKATLTFSNSYYSLSTGTTPEDEVVVFTYGLNGKKVDGENKETVLKDAEFKIYYEDSQGNRKYAKIIDNVASEWTSTESEGTTVKSDANGQFVIKGLDAGTYYLEEEVAPSGYNKLKKPVKFTIKPTKKNTQAYKDVDSYNGAEKVLTGLQVSVEEGNLVNGDTSTGMVDVTVENNKGITLPSTGGEGVNKLLYIAGGIMVVVAGIYLISKRRADAH